MNLLNIPQLYCDFFMYIFCVQVAAGIRTGTTGSQGELMTCLMFLVRDSYEHVFLAVIILFYVFV